MGRCDGAVARPGALKVTQSSLCSKKHSASDGASNQDHRTLEAEEALEPHDSRRGESWEKKPAEHGKESTKVAGYELGLFAA